LSRALAAKGDHFGFVARFKQSTDASCRTNEWIQDHVIEDDDELGEYVSMNLFFSDFQAPEK
jgi:hypothetical protein